MKGDLGIVLCTVRSASLLGVLSVSLSAQHDHDPQGLAERLERIGIDTATARPATDSRRKVTLAAAGIDGALLIPDSTTDSVSMFDPFDGEYIGDLIDGSGILATPINAVEGPDDNIYVADQIQDAVFVFDAAGSFLFTYADASDGLNNPRGIDFFNGHLFVTSGDGYVAEFSAPHTRLPDHVNDGSEPFDVLFLADGSALLTNVAGSGSVQVHQPNGELEAVLFPALFPEQVQADLSHPAQFLEGEFSGDLVASFAVDGTVLQSTPVNASVRGVQRLGNGNLLVTGSTGVIEVDPATGATIAQKMPGVGWRFIELVGDYTPPVQFAGIAHTPVGGAQLTVEADALVVTGLGPDGDDGVRSELGPVDSHRVKLRLPNPGVLPTGAGLQCTAVGSVGGLDDQPILTLGFVAVASVLAVTLDASAIAPSTVRIDAYLDDTVVGSLEHPDPPPQATHALATFSALECEVRVLLASGNESRSIIQLPSPTPTNLLTGDGPVLADRLVVTAVGSAGASPGWSQQTATEIKGAGVGSIAILDETIGAFDKDLRTIGDALLQGTDVGLAVETLGKSGDDGVAIMLDEVTDPVHVEVADLVLGNAGAFYVSSRGTFSGQADTLLGEAAITAALGGTFSVVADFSSVGATSVLVQVWKNSKLVSSSNALGGGVVADVVFGSASLTSVVRRCSAFPGDPTGLAFAFDDDYLVMSSGGGQHAGDELRLLASNAQGATDAISKLDVRAGGTPSLDVRCVSGAGIATYGQACPGSGAVAPTLTMTGCPVIGGEVTLMVAGGPPSALAFLFLGLTEADVPLGAGCSFLVGAVLVQVAAPLAADGTLAVPVTLPTDAPGITATLQMLIIDPAAAIGASFSNGVRLQVDG